MSRFTQDAYRSLEVHAGVVTLQDACIDREAFIPVRNIVSVQVNWLIEGGALEIRTSQASGNYAYTVTFDAGDYGQACAEAISELFEAWAPPGPAKETAVSAPLPEPFERHRDCDIVMHATSDDVYRVLVQDDDHVVADKNTHHEVTEQHLFCNDHYVRLDYPSEGIEWPL